MVRKQIYTNQYKRKSVLKFQALVVLENINDKNGFFFNVNLILPKTRSFAKASNTLEPPMTLLKAADQVAVNRPTATLDGNTLTPAINK